MLTQYHVTLVRLPKRVNAKTRFLLNKARGWLDPILLDPTRRLEDGAKFARHRDFLTRGRVFARETRYCSTGFFRDLDAQG